MGQTEKKRRGYAVGVQMFDWIRERGSVYVVFLTGFSKFSQLSVFSELNNLQQLTSDQINFEEFVETVRCWYAGIPYSITDKNQNEQLYQSLIYAALIGIGADVSAEEQTSDGRMDIALKVPHGIYILELKYGKTAEEAADQVIKKNYVVRFATDPRPVWAVGMNISEDRRTIDQWKVVKVK